MSLKYKRKEAETVARVKASSQTKLDSKPIRPAITPEAEENQMIALAVNLVKQRLIDGTASSQETTHYLKLASRKAKLEAERAELENELIKAKTQSIRDQADIKSLYKDAIAAMRRYSGHGSESEDEEEFNEY